MKYLFITLIGLYTLTSFSQTEEIKWMSWFEAVEQHKQDMKAYNENTGEDKVLPKKFFLDIYTDWCGWCKKMDASTFKDPVIAKYMNDNFYPVKMDAEMGDTIVFNNHEFVNPQPKQGKGRAGTHQFAASILDYQLSYPSYVILDENVSRMVIYKGYKNIEDMLGVLLFFGKNQHVPYQQGLEKQFELKLQQEQK